MEFTVQFDEENDCVTGSFTGDFDIEMLKPAVKKLKYMEFKYPCQRFINDIRKLKFAFSKKSIYTIPDILFSLGIDKSWKRAVLVSKSDQESAQFFVNVMTRRGYTIECFLDKDEALEWLKSISLPHIGIQL